MSTTADSPSVLDADQAIDDSRSFFDFDSAPPLIAATVPGSPFPPPSPPTTSVPPAPPTLSPKAAALPTLAPAALQQAHKPAPNPFVSPLDTQFDTPKSPKQNVKKGRVKRFFGFLVLLALIGGAAAGVVLYGPELMTLAKGESETTEPTAPLAFPVATAVAPIVRTATFTVENPVGSDMPLSYEVTTDFETGISQILIDRNDQPQLEILTVFDGAVIRRTDEQVWFELKRGDFPIDRDAGRERWVRSLDELFPPGIREFTTIENASESLLEDEAMRHLVVSIDPDHLVAETPIGLDAVTDGAELIVEPVAPPSMPPGITLREATVAGELVTIEMWVDNSGTVRRLVLPAVLGGETVTVISTSPDAWQPQFPDQELVEPLTASALFGLGL
ncbi:MAG: hypothetical protein IZT58_05460 [Actinobacteria bacterium]|nr:hypothetical protein [Actinomycetota bacterium]